MNRLFLFVGCSVIWPIMAMAQTQPEVIFEQGFENLPDAVEILGLNANPASVYEGQNTTITWLLKDATSCTATDGTPQWQALSFDGSDGSFDVVTLTTAGNYVFTLTCTGPVGDPAVAAVTVFIEVAPPAQILSFTAAPGTIEVDETTTLSWTLQDAVSCTTSGGTAQWQAMTIDGNSSSVEITDLDTAGVFQFALTCLGFAGDSVADIAEVTVEALNCVAPSLGVGINKSWVTFWGQEFPNSNDPAVAQPINTGNYLSIQFDTAAVVNNGEFIAMDFPFTIGTRLGTISRCIGQFEAAAECTHTWVAEQADTTGISWATDGKVGACTLKPNTTYFFNVTYTDGVNSNTDSCTSPDCIVSITHNLDPVDP